MDAKSIWPGFDYAWTQYPSRGVEYYAGASRVKAITTLERVDSGNTRNTTYVKVIRLTQEGEPKTHKVWNSETNDYVEEEFIDEVRARELFMRWDEYEDETITRNAQKEEEELRRQKIREERERERIERERLDRERREREEAERVERRRRISEGLSRIGMEGNIDTYSERVTMTFEEFLRWLSSLERVDCGQCNRQLVRIPSS